jgi:hypothetical protein
MTWNEVVMAYLGICLHFSGKTNENLSQDRHRMGQELNPEPPEYDSTLLTIQMRHSV